MTTQTLPTLPSTRLFSYATSELSQDAFICWLLACADPRIETTDPALRACGVTLIEAFFVLHKITCPEIETITVRKQDNRIDVLCIINQTYAILIEDKTNADASSGQLQRHLETVERHEEIYRDDVLPIHCKTGNASLGSYWRVEEAGYAIFLRQDLLEVLDTYSGDNAILLDYRGQLQAIEGAFNSYATTKLDTWGLHAWEGFYTKLEQEIEGGYWFTPNGRGGVVVFGWGGHFFGDDDLCIQLEQQLTDLENTHPLSFKLHVTEESRRVEQRLKWWEALERKAPEFGLDLKRTRFDSNPDDWMSVAKLYQDCRVAKEDGTLDLAATVDFLHKVEALQVAVVESEPSD